MLRQRWEVPAIAHLVHGLHLGMQGARDSTKTVPDIDVEVHVCSRIAHRSAATCVVWLTSADAVQRLEAGLIIFPERADELLMELHIKLLRAKLRAAADPARRRSKRLQDLADALALTEKDPSLQQSLSSEERAKLASLP